MDEEAMDALVDDVLDDIAEAVTALSTEEAREFYEILTGRTATMAAALKNDIERRG